MRLSSRFYYKSGQWSADFITVVRVHKPSSCPTDYTFCFKYRFLVNVTATKEMKDKSTSSQKVQTHELLYYTMLSTNSVYSFTQFYLNF